MARKAVSNDRYRLVGTYERLRRVLLDSPDKGTLEKPLSYWVLPTDRRLPIAFLDRRLGELLEHPLDELMGTQGVGYKKILGFFDLLKRASKGGPSDVPFGLTPSEPKKKLAQPDAESPTGFDATIVSEALWTTWCSTVRRFHVQDEKLGRLAPSLQSLPTVIWHTPLSAYVDLSLQEIRNLKTHGEKRVNAIMEVFCTVHEALSTATLQENVDLVVVPRFVGPVTRWILEVLEQPELPEASEMHRSLVQPLIEQIRTDLGGQVAELADSRLSLDVDVPSVKQFADKLGVTRARIYQLLEECGAVMQVRWPEGRWMIGPLTNKFGSGSPESMGLVHAVLDLFYPSDQRSPSTEDLAAADI